MMIKIFVNCFFALIFVFNLKAAVVTKVKGDKVLIDLEGDSVEVNSKFYLINESEKPVAGIKILAIKNGEAVGQLIKGTSQGNEKLKALEAKTKNEDDTKKVVQTSELKRKAKNFQQKKYYIMGTYSFNAVNSDVVDSTDEGEALTITGTGVGLTFGNEWIRLGKFSFDTIARLYTINTKGDSSLVACDNKTSNTCVVKVSYLDLGLATKIHFENNNWDYYTGLDLIYKSAIAKSSTLVTTDKIKSGVALGFQLGLYYKWSSSLFLPFEFEQVFQSKIEGAKVSTTLFSIGAGFFY